MCVQGHKHISANWAKAAKNTEQLRTHNFQRLAQKATAVLADKRRELGFFLVPSMPTGLLN
jgi:hypothetical protein